MALFSERNPQKKTIIPEFAASTAPFSSRYYYLRPALPIGRAITALVPPRMSKPDATFYRDVYDIVSQIPAGRVLTYGAIARLAGWPHHSRMVGRALRDVSETLRLPCHRVVNASGRTAPAWPEQAALLRAEGIPFKPNGCADLPQCLWEVARKDYNVDATK